MILGIIPARGGSKGVPRKNIKPLCGRPLIAWSIDAARRSKLLDRFVVSTEDAEIASISRSLGAEVLDRPPRLAEDHVISREVIRHALEATGADVSVLLQPTNPIRDDDLIDRAVQAFLDGGFDSLATGWMNPQYPPHGEEHRRQDISDSFVNDGSVVISTRRTIMDGSLFGQNAGIMVTDREQNVDIDDDFDFFLAEKIMERRLAADPEHQRRRRDDAARDRHLMAAHFLQAVVDQCGPGAAHQVAAQAFRTYADQIWTDQLGGLTGADRIDKFFRIMTAAAENNPDLDLTARGRDFLSTLAEQCGGEKVWRDLGLIEYFKHFCDQDFEIARLISPNGRLDRPETLAQGHPACRHHWKFDRE